MIHVSKLSVVPIALVGFSLPALAQGADCSDPIVVQGVGQEWAAGAVGGASGWPVLDCHTEPNLDDRFYQWQAPADGWYHLYSFNSMPIITVQWFDGIGCAATLRDCVAHGYNDFFADAPIGWMQAGDPLMIRTLGALVGNVRLEFMGEDGAGLPVDRLDPNNDCSEALSLGNGSYADLHLNAQIGDRWDTYSLCVAPGDTLSLAVSTDFPSSLADLRLELIERGFGPDPCGYWAGTVHLEAIDSAPALTHTNTSNEPQYFDVSVTAPRLEGLLTYRLDVSGANACGGVPVVTTFCDPMDPNSSGLPLQLDAVWGTGVHSGIRLEADQGPVGQFASLIVGNAFTEPGVALGQGRFCLGQAAGQQFGRYNIGGTVLNSIGQFDGTGRFANLVGTSLTQYGFDVPTVLPNFGVRIEEGTTWHFQMWTRDLGGQSNWSNGVSVQFTSLP